MVKCTLQGLITAIFFTTCAHAAVLQNQGEVYSIAENDFRHFIYDRLAFLDKTGALKQFEQDTITRVTRSINRPTPLSITTAGQSSIYYVSPEMVITKDIRLPSGQLIVKKGSVINPMNRVQFNSTLIFFNADDKAQLHWVSTHKKDYPFAKLILTGGDIKETTQQLGRIYFDQKGLIAQQLHIKHVPSLASQEANQWKIVVIGEKELNP